MNNDDIIKIESINNNDFIIRWKLTSLCNYNCSFCIQGNKQRHINESKKESIKIRENICKNLIKFIENKLNGKYKKLRIVLIGGEVTILKDFLDILEKLINCKFNNNIVINITTNASFDKLFIKKLKKIVYSKTKNMRKLNISCSFYNEYTTDKDLINKLKLLSKKSILNRIYSKNILSTSIGYPIKNNKDFNDYLVFKKKYSKYVSNINYILIRGENIKLSKKCIDIINDIENSKNKIYKVTLKNGDISYYSSMRTIGQSIKDFESFNPVNYECDSGISSFSIMTDGKVYRCVREDKRAYIGDLNETYNIELPTDMFNCKYEKCVCSYFKNIIKIQ